MKHLHRELTLAELVRLVGTSGMALPQFQRDFVWGPNRVTSLLESVANGWPVGAFLLLQGPQPFEVKPFDSGPDVDKGANLFYVLDGQQRATSLYHALADAGDDYVYLIDLTDDYGDSRFKWERRDRYRWTPQRPLVRQLWDDHEFSLLVSELSIKDSTRAKHLRSEAMGFLISEQGYRLPATVMEHDIELEALVRIFETLNRTGVKLDAFDLMVALLYPSGFKLREQWEDALAGHRSLQIFDANGIELLKLIALWERSSPAAPRGVKGVRQRDVLSVRPTTVESEWRRAADAYEYALEYLNRFGVTDRESLPAEAMVLTLAFVLDRGVVEAEIDHWYFRSIATQSYAQGANTRVLSDIEYLTSRRGDAGPIERESVVVDILDLARRNRILRKGLAGLAGVQGWLDPMTGATIEPPVRTIPVAALMGSSLALGSWRVADLLFVGKGSIDSTSSAGRDDFQIQSSAANALASQGFGDPRWLDSPPDALQSLRRRRAEFLADWLANALP